MPRQPPLGGAHDSFRGDLGRWIRGAWHCHGYPIASTHARWPSRHFRRAEACCPGRSRSPLRHSHLPESHDRDRAHRAVRQGAEARVRQPHRSVPELPHALRLARDRPPLDAPVQGKPRNPEQPLQRPGAATAGVFQRVPGRPEPLLSYLIKDGYSRSCPSLCPPWAWMRCSPTTTTG